MKKIFTLLAIALVMGSVEMKAQRYLEEVFDDVEVTSDVVYGVNATVLYYSVLGEAIPEALELDLYEPAGDTETARPLILYFHTGNFLPHPQNGSPSGTRTDSTTVELCKRFARMGYVVASCDYRLGWNPIAPTQEERVNTLINAAYRGVQDARTAARYFRMTEAELANPYGIDPDRIVVWGQGTGGYISLAASTIDEYADILIPKFIGSNLLPMVIEQVNGDIFGTSVGVNPLDNDTLCYINHAGYSSDFQACVNMGGAMGDLSWLDAGDGPFISFHTPTDPFAPYTEGTVIVPVLNLPVVDVNGSYDVQEFCAANGNNASFTIAGFDDAYSTAANNFNDGLDGLFPFVRPAGSEADSAPWEWWDPATNPNSDAGFATNPDMTAMKGMTFCDSIQMYAAPRLACALGLPNSPCEGLVPANDLCADAIDVSDLMGGGLDVPVASDTFSNEGATAESGMSGISCFEDNNNAGPMVNNSVWFTFTGDGEAYTITTGDCGGTATFFEGDTQMAVYSGSCGSLVAEECNEDIDFNGLNYYSEVTIETEAGVEYFIMVDGYDYTSFGGDPASGDFCLTFTQTEVSVSELNSVQVSMYPNPANAELNIRANGVVSSVEVYNVVGELVLTANPRNSFVTLNVDALEGGIYTVRVTTANGESVQRFVKQ
ncbi:MAG: hypothetical protein RL226_1131 [Bacteroidota bacterium]|jgi:hypothetical protein